jgi:hypothetical protein
VVNAGGADQIPVVAKPTVRERLAAAAFALFNEHGYEQATVDDIAERAGVGRTTFFRHYRSKEDVIFPDPLGPAALPRRGRPSPPLLRAPARYPRCGTVRSLVPPATSGCSVSLSPDGWPMAPGPSRYGPS